MASDAHCHPFDTFRMSGAAVPPPHPLAASAWGDEDFSYNEALARRADTASHIALCFGCHPQLCSAENAREMSAASLETLARLCAENRIDAIGECGWDLFDAHFKASEALQDEVFAAHITLAQQSGLPLVLHIRKAMHKVFVWKKELRRLPAVVFHSYSGGLEEMRSLLAAGVNAYFSFGSVIVHDHKRAIRCCAECPPEHILFETDSPYQHSVYDDITVYIKAASVLRGESAEELEKRSDANWRRVFLTKRETLMGAG
jgi:TatD DNase family protein